MISKEEAERMERQMKMETGCKLGEVPGGADTIRREQQRGKKIWRNHAPEEEETETPLEDLIDGM
jgi:hypothetical protein